MPVSPPYNFDDANTAQVEVTGKWRVVAPTGVAVAPTSDFPNNAYPTGTFIIPANALTRRASWTVTTLPNLTVTGDRYYDMEVYDVLPANSQITNPRVRTKIVEDDVSSEPTVEIVYGPFDAKADSEDLDFSSNRQLFGRTWKVGAPRWKVIAGMKDPGSNRTGLLVTFYDDLGYLDYAPLILNGIMGDRSTRVPYSGDPVTAAEKYTFFKSDATSLRYYCAATADRANPRLLATIPFAMWADATFWERYGGPNNAGLPGKYGQSNAEAQLADGIYAARLGAVQ